MTHLLIIVQLDLFRSTFYKIVLFRVRIEFQNNFWGQIKIVAELWDVAEMVKEFWAKI